MPGQPFDATLKDLMEGHAADWPRLLGPWSVLRAEALDADVSTISGAADKALRVESKGLTWILHVEPQSSHKLEVPERASWYNSVLHKRTGLLVRSVVLLLRPEANASNLTGQLALQFPDEPDPYLFFRYRIVRLWELPAERLLAGGLGTLPLAPLTNDAVPDLQAVLGRIDARLRQEAPPDEADKLRTATGVLMGLRYPEDLVQRVLQGASAMWEEVLEDSSVYQGAIKRGERIGEERGELRGEIRGAKEILLALGTERFGPPGAAAAAALEALSDLPRLRELGKRVLTAPGWRELLA